MKYIEKLTSTEIERFVENKLKSKFKWEFNIIDLCPEEITSTEFSTSLIVRDFSYEHVCKIKTTCHDFDITIDCDVDGETVTYRYEKEWIAFMYNWLKHEEKIQLMELPLIQKMCRMLDEDVVFKQYKKDCIKHYRNLRKRKSNNNDVELN